MLSYLSCLLLLKLAGVWLTFEGQIQLQWHWRWLLAAEWDVKGSVNRTMSARFTSVLVALPSGLRLSLLFRTCPPFTMFNLGTCRQGWLWENVERLLQEQMGKSGSFAPRLCGIPKLGPGRGIKTNSRMGPDRFGTLISEESHNVFCGIPCYVE